MFALPARAVGYILGVSMLGGAAGVWAGIACAHWRSVLLLAAFSLVCTAASQVDNANTSYSLGFVIAVAADLIVGLSGIILVAASIVVVDIYRRVEWYKLVFNCAAVALSGLVAGLAYWGTGAPVGGLIAADFPLVLPKLAVTVCVYDLVNIFLVSGAVALTGAERFRSVFAASARRMMLAPFAYSLLSLAMALLWERFSPLAGSLVVIPILVARVTLRQRVDEQREYDATVASIIQAVEAKDSYTRGHSERVSHGAVLIAQELGLPEEQVSLLRYAGMFHDVGKLGVPTSILQKEGRLSESEVAEIAAHPAQGAQLLQGIEFLRDAIAAIYHHHERIDGRGYPQGLRGDEIPLAARVIAVADAFDAMTSSRSYRAARPVPEAMAELRRGAGTQFDARIVDAMLRAVTRLGWQPGTAVPAQGTAAGAAVSGAVA